MRFVIYIEPVAKGRPRFSNRTKRMHSPKSTVAFEREFRKLAEQVLGGAEYPVYPEGVPLAVDVDFVRKRPQDFDKRGGSLQAARKLWNPRVYDIDNLVKAVFDSLNGVMWHDDKQIVAVRMRKFFAGPGEKPRICVHVRRVGLEPEVLCDDWGDEVDYDWGQTERDVGGYSSEPEDSPDDRQITIMDVIDAMEDSDD